jgi:hypothetical protein
MTSHPPSQKSPLKAIVPRARGSVKYEPSDGNRTFFNSMRCMSGKSENMSHQFLQLP